MQTPLRASRARHALQIRSVAFLDRRNELAYLGHRSRPSLCARSPRATQTAGVCCLHNVPLALFGENLSLKSFRRVLRAYSMQTPL